MFVLTFIFDCCYNIVIDVTARFCWLLLAISTFLISLVIFVFTSCY